MSLVASCRTAAGAHRESCFSPLARAWRFDRFAAIVEYADHPATLRCCGDEDRATQARRRQALVRAMQGAHATSSSTSPSCRFADASLMLDFAMLARRLRAQGHALALRDPQPQIRALIELVGLDRLPGVRIDVEPVSPSARAAAARRDAARR